MTVLLVLFTLIVFLALDHFVQRSRTRPLHDVERVQPSQLFPSPLLVPEGVSLATNHTWVRKNDDGTITIGLDEFLSRLLGRVDRVSIPCAGSTIAPAVADIALGARGHSLHLAPPITGSVVESNLDILRDPSLIRSDPYAKGWLVRIKSREEDLTSLTKYAVRRPAEWMREQLGLVRDFIAMNVEQGEPILLQEGGLMIEGVLQQFDETIWKDFNRCFASLHKTKDSEFKEKQS